MAKSNNQKVKILYLQKMLHETGENRVVTMQDILASLQEYGVHAERKSIYDDIESLRSFGMDVKFKRGRPGGYFLAGQMAPEKPAAEGKENEAVGQEAEAAKSEAEIARQEAEAAKREAEIARQEAEAAKRDAETAKREAEALKREAKAHSKEEKEPLPEKVSRQNWKFEKEADSNNGKQMKLLCRDKTKKAVQAYLGKAAQYKEKELGYFTVTAVLKEGPQFYGWLASMGRDVHILKPKKAALNYREYLKTLVKEYKGI